MNVIKFECEDRQFVAVEKDGKITVAEIIVESPRSAEDLESQALSELEDCGTFEN